MALSDLPLFGPGTTLALTALMSEGVFAAIPFLLFITLIIGMWLILEHLIPSLISPAHRFTRGLTRWTVRATGVQERLARGGERLSVWRVYLPVVAILAAGTLASVVAGGVFLELAETLTEDTATLEQFDEQVYRWANEIRISHATPFFTAMTIIGTPVGLGIIAAAIAAVLVARRLPRLAAYLIATPALGGVINKLLKAWFARARPEVSEMLRETTGYSFPSGHAMGSTLVFGALIYIAFRTFKSRRARAFWAAVCIASVLAISFSRIYLGVHWISDIVAGIAAGTTWVLATTSGYEIYRRMRRIRRGREAVQPQA